MNDEDKSKIADRFKPWENWEDRKVLYLYQRHNTTLSAIAARHQRSRNAIRYRLAMLLGVPMSALRFVPEAVEVPPHAPYIAPSANCEQIVRDAATYGTAFAKTGLSGMRPTGYIVDDPCGESAEVEAKRTKANRAANAVFQECGREPANAAVTLATHTKQIAELKEAICPRVAARLAALEKLLEKLLGVLNGR